MRPRFKVKAGLQGSSDFAHILSKKVQLESAHQEFVNSQLSIDLMAVSLPEPDPNRLVKVRVWGKPVTIPYKRAKELNLNWEYVL